MEKILIIDDETPIRSMVRLILERAGYTVREAQDGTVVGDKAGVVREHDVLAPGELDDRDQGRACHPVAAHRHAVDDRTGRTLRGEERVGPGPGRVVEEPDVARTLTAGVGLDVEGAVTSLRERYPLDRQVPGGRYRHAVSAV